MLFDIDFCFAYIFLQITRMQMLLNYDFFKPCLGGIWRSTRENMFSLEPPSIHLFQVSRIGKFYILMNIFQMLSFSRRKKTLDFLAPTLEEKDQAFKETSAEKEMANTLKGTRSKNC